MTQAIHTPFAMPSTAAEELVVLLVEDDPTVRLGCMQALLLEGIPCHAVGSAEEALSYVQTRVVGMVVTDVRLPGMDGLALQSRLQAEDPQLPVVMITGHGGVSMAVNAMRNGAYDFIEKPFSSEQLVDVVQRALDKRRLSLEVITLRRLLDNRQGIERRLIGKSPAIERLRQTILAVASTPADVLILGETGTGKELVARCLHDFGVRKDKPFVAVNCGGMPENLFESEMFGHEAGAFTGAAKKRIGKIEHAHGGTLFLDEIETMPIPLQIKLLRVLQERQVERLGSNQPVSVDCRVVAATKADLEELGQRGEFRADLYYRLNVVTLELPPLRERREDIPLLFEHFLLQAAERFQRPAPVMTPVQMRALMAHEWPGNVRELRNMAERYVLGLCGESAPFAATPEPQRATLPDMMEAFERRVIAEEMQRQKGSLSRAAQALGVPKTTLHDKIKRLGLLGESL